MQEVCPYELCLILLVKQKSSASAQSYQGYVHVWAGLLPILTTTRLLSLLGDTVNPLNVCHFKGKKVIREGEIIDVWFVLS